MFLSTVILIGVAFTLVFTGRRGPNARQAFRGALFLQTIAYTFVFGSFLVIYSVYASWVNDAYDRHRQTLTMHCLHLDEKNENYEKRLRVESDLGPSMGGFGNRSSEIDILLAKLKRSKMCERTIVTAVQMLTITSDAAPIEIFGIRANTKLTFTLLSGLLSFGVAIAASYLRLSEVVVDPYVV